MRDIFSFIRRNPWNYNDALVFVCNFAPVTREPMEIGVPVPGEYERIFSTYADEEQYSLSAVEEECDGRPYRLVFKLRPYESLIFSVPYHESTEEEKEKLSVLVNSNDGFEIAEADLRLRGPGTISGTKQSGFPEFAFASIATDLRMFECARQDASYILEHEADPQFAYLLQEARKSSQGISLA